MKILRFKYGRASWKRTEVIVFLETLESYLSSGLGLDSCLQMIGHGIRSSRKQSCREMQLLIERGILFSNALEQHVTTDSTIVSLIRHGEASGTLVSGIALARSILEQRDQLIKNCLSALAYPCIIGFFAAILVIALMRGVMPQIIPMLQSLHVQLPVLTQVVIFCSDIVTQHGLYLVLACSAVIVACVSLYKKFERIRSACQQVLLRIPIVGGLVHNYVISVFLYSCGALLSSGAPIGRSYASTIATISILPLRTFMQSHASRIDGGAKLSSVFIDKRFALHIPALISAGESSGTLGQSCIRTAELLDRDIQHALKRITSIIEPLMMVGMGITIGAIALSILMPIYEISRVLQK